MNAPACLYECSKIIKVGPNHKGSFFIFVLLLLFYTCTGVGAKDNTFDYFVFSQRWLPTACIEYMENGSPYTHICDLPKNFKVWSIHGLWPTQNKSMGPFYCDPSLHFDISKITPIEPVMEICWPNIEWGKTLESLWQHEWDKHGTCAAQLDTLNSEFKYFNASLMLYKTHNVQRIFKENQIPLDKGIQILPLFSLLKSSVGKVPQIHCVKEKKTKRQLLHEIRLCFSKNLELIDCGNIHNSGDYFLNGYTNCHADEYVILPSTADPPVGSAAKADMRRNEGMAQNEEVPPNSADLDFYYKLHAALSIIRFLQWASI